MEVAATSGNHCSDDDQSDHGRRRVIIIANLPKVKESYDDIGCIFKQLNISDDIPWVLVADLKFTNIVIGLSTNATSFWLSFQRE